ncbi:MAG: cyclase family protein [Nitrospinota bacterium]
MKIVDLSMEIHRDMMVYQSLPQPMVLMLESWQGMAARFGTTRWGVDIAPGHYVLIMSDHTGTHIDAPYHNNPEAERPAGIPLEWCFSDGVVLDFSDKKPGYEITPRDLERALKKIGYELKPLDIVLIRTDVGKICHKPEYLTQHPGVGAAATEWLIDQGIRVMGIDAPGWDIPVWAMFKRKKFWESHRVMLKKPYCHVENMVNLHRLRPPFGFKVSLLPLKLRDSTGSPIRAVAIYE